MFDYICYLCVYVSDYTFDFLLLKQIDAETF